MIAEHALGVFSDLLDRLADLAPSDTINDDPQPYDDSIEDDPTFSFLTDDALPEDPSKAAIVGLIDDALPMVHQQLRVGAATSRVASVWFQDVPPNLSVPVGDDLPFGREFRGAQISDLLAQLDAGDLVDENALYNAAGIIDMRRNSPQRLALAGGHGSSVAGLAAGVAPGEDALGRSLPVIAVSLPPYVVRDTLGTAAPFYILLATLHIIHRARRLCRFVERRQNRPAGSVRMPVIINLSFGLTAGAKDGSSDLERFFDAVAAAENTDLGPVRFVLAIGNHRQARLRAKVPANAGEPVQWQVKPDDMTPSFVEIWGPAAPGAVVPPTPMQIECTPPGHTIPVRTTFTGHGTYQRLEAEGAEVARAYLQYREFDGHIREFVTLVIPPTRPERLSTVYGIPGRWALRVIAPDGDFDVFVQRDDVVRGFGMQRGRQSELLDAEAPVVSPDGRMIMRDPPAKTLGVLRSGTINAFACGKNQIRVGGAYAATDVAVPYSSLAMEALSPSVEGDVMGIAEHSQVQRGVRVIGTQSGSRSLMSGTSMAAPMVTRELAMAFIEGAVTDTSHAGLVALLQQRAGWP